MTRCVPCPRCGSACDVRGMHCPGCGLFVRERLSERQPPTVTVTIVGADLMRSALEEIRPRIERAVRRAVRDALKDRGPK